MTTSSPLSEHHFRHILALHPTGLETADALVKQASKRLDILSRTGEAAVFTPPTAGERDTKVGGYPFPRMDSLSPPTVKSSARKSNSRHGSAAYTVRSLSDQRDTVRAPRTSEANGNTIRVSNKKGESRHTRTASRLSAMSTWSTQSRFLTIPNKSSLSLASVQVSPVDIEVEPVSVETSFNGGSAAVDVLKRVERSDLDLRRHMEMWFASPVEGDQVGQCSMPHSQDHSLSPPEDTFLSITPKPSTKTTEQQRYSLRPAASSPNLGAIFLNSPPPLRPAQSSLHLISKAHSDVNMTPDPVLAAAELASALTQKMKCGACGGEGVNFPECRKCGGRFCSRACRVGERGEGHGCKAGGKGRVEDDGGKGLGMGGSTVSVGA